MQSRKMPCGAWSPITWPIPAPAHQGCSSLLEPWLVHGTAGTQGTNQLKGERRVSTWGIPTAPPSELARSILHVPHHGGIDPSLGRGMKHQTPSMGLARAAADWGSLIPLAPWWQWGGCSLPQLLPGHSEVSNWTPVPGSGGDPFAPAGAPLESKVLPAAGRAGVWPASLRAACDGFQMAHRHMGLAAAFFRQLGWKGVLSKGNIRQKAAGGAGRRRR